MKRTFVYLSCFITIGSLLILAGCTTIPVEEPPKELVQVSSIGILPAYAAQSTILPSNTKTREELEAGADIINSLVHDYFKNNQNVSFISRFDLERMDSSKSGRILNMAKEVGEQLFYDAVLVTTVKRYQTRQGTDYSVVRPASVAFTFQLLAIKSGQVIWRAEFDQTQKTLFENILPSTRSTGSGFRWLTAAELASAGLTKRLDSSPYFK